MGVVLSLLQTEANCYLNKAFKVSVKKHFQRIILSFPGKPVEVLIEFKLMAFGKIREEEMVSHLLKTNHFK